MEYTKGEWEVVKHGITYQIQCNQTNKLPYGIARDIYSRANAHLIAAAPDMYEALKDIRQIIKIYSPVSKMGGDIRLLIQKAFAKAEGE